MTGLVVTMIELALVRVGIQHAAGSVPAIGTSEYGSALDWSAAAVMILVTPGREFFGRGMLAVSAVLLGGSLHTLAVGILTPAAVAGWWSDAAPFALPHPFRQGIEFSAAAVLGFRLMTFVPAVETVGDVSAIAKGGSRREATDREVRAPPAPTASARPWRASSAASPTRPPAGTSGSSP